MGFKQILIERLTGKLDERLFEFLPNGYQKVGHIVIVNLREELKNSKEIIGKELLNFDKSIKTVCVKSGVITGDLRRPQIEFVCGEEDFVVENFENGVWFCYDVRKIMFAKGNVSERGRLPKLVKEDETIVDMFIGIGYFSLPIAKLSNPKIIYGIDLNEDSIHWLKESIKKNKLNNIEVIRGDSKDEVKNLIKKGIIADRVLMGYLPPPEEFIPYALKILKKEGIVHYDALIRPQHYEKDIEHVLELFRKEGRKIELINPQRVKSYGPKVDHYVLDIKLF